MGQELRFDKQTVVVTGAGAGLGKAYAVFFASRGANVVVNDLGGGFKGDGQGSKNAADQVVDQIKKAGGSAVANYDSVEHGDKIVDTAIQNFGRIDVLINNAGILRDISFKNMKDVDWDLIFKVHMEGAFKCSRAAWPYFRKQKYGRVIFTTSAAGLFGSFGQCNYSAAKLGLVGFTETLAKEGVKYNILSNVIAPIAASRLTETVMPPEMLELLKPDYVVPLVAVLSHSSTKENGAIFEVGGGHMAKFRWERAKGLHLKTDENMTPGSVLERWKEVLDYSSGAEHPTSGKDSMKLVEVTRSLPANKKSKDPDFSGKVAVVTGAGGGVGGGYASVLARLGAKVVVNDLANPDQKVEEIKKAGGEAVADKHDVNDGEAIIKTAIDNYGRIDILINNAGILADKSFQNMTEDQFNKIMKVHMRGTYSVAKAAWPHFLKQKYGRVVNTASTSGVYGNFGQANYAAAKCAIVGFSRALALEGQKYNIHVNTICPIAGTQLTASVMPPELHEALQPQFVAPLVVLLVSDSCPEPTGGLYEAGMGWQAQTRWQRSQGKGFPVDAELKPEHVVAAWDELTSFNEHADNPATPTEGQKSIMANAQNKNKKSKL